MLIEFTVGNYRSFKEPVTLSMVATKTRARNKQVDANNVFVVDDKLSLLKSAAVYGANASGKSNLIGAIHFMRVFVLNSSEANQVLNPIDVEQFRLSTETAGQPSFFEVVFLLEGKQYRYGFEVTLERVIREWLYYVPTIREAKLFVREADHFEVSDAFREGRGIEDRTRANALFLSVVAQFNGPIAQKVQRWFAELVIVLGLDDWSNRWFTERSFESGKYRREIISFVRKLDVGIDHVLLEKREGPLRLPTSVIGSLNEATPGAREVLKQPGLFDLRKVTTIHPVFDTEGRPETQELFDLDKHESEGTKKLFALSGPLIDALKKGDVLIIDEMEARLHPLMTCEIISLFHSPEANPHNAQLIFTTHDTNLLSNDTFRRDQIWFTEKDGQGATHLYSLVEYKVRNDASFEKNYIEGRYGAVPFIGDLRSLLSEADV